MFKLKLSLTLTALTLAAPSAHAAGTLGAGVPNFSVRDGYKVTVAAQDFGQARFIQPGENGMLYVSQPNAGTISTLKKGGDGTYKKIGEFTTGKKTVHGMDFKDGWLWFTQSGSVWKGRDTDGDGKADEEIEILKDLPSGGGHWYRSICVTDNGFFTSIGDSGNITDLTDSDREKVWFYDLDGSGKKLWCGGIRNTEKLRMRPASSDLYGADHGSDWYGKPLGDSEGNQPITNRVPPDEFNHYVEGGFYGHPFIVGNGLPRLEFKDRPDIIELAAKTILPAWPFGAHWATNGWTFAQTDGLGAKGDAFVACHGSWNSTQKVGYRIERVLFDSQTGNPMGAQEIVSTLDGQDVKDRPVDCAEESDGSILFSADSGKIYRISRAK